MKSALSMLPFVKFDSIDALHHYKDVGGEFLEVAPLDVDYRYTSEDRFRAYQRTLDELDLKPVQVHLPYRGPEGNDIGNLNELIRDYSVEIVRKALDYAARLGVRWAVLHPGSLETIEDEHVHRKVVDNVIESCRVLHRYGAERGVTLCVENMFARKGVNVPPDPDRPLPTPAGPTYRFGICADDLLMIRSAIPDIHFCFDPGHALLNGLNLVGEIRKLGQSLAALHLNENNADWDAHKIPWQTGRVDWRQFIDALVEIGYDKKGFLTLEVRRGDNHAESMSIAADAVSAGHKLAGMHAEIVGTSTPAAS